MGDIRLMKGNEVIAEAAIRCGCDAYYGYPITPQSEVMETLMLRKPWDETGMVVLQAESELAAINMVLGGASSGRKVMTSSSSPGISLMAECISFLAGSELPCLLVDVQRGGPGLGTIQPSQSDYFQATKGGGHGDYRLYVLAPSSVQEMHDFVGLGFEMAFKYRNPVMILSDGVIGQMMEKVELGEFKPRWTDEEIKAMSDDWACTGKGSNRNSNIITSLHMKSEDHEIHNQKLQAKYSRMEQEDVRYEEILCDDAEYLIVAYGLSARISQKAVEILRDKGVKVGLLRPITLFPFPKEPVAKLAGKVKGILSVEMNAGQMIEDIKLAAEGKTKVVHHGRMGGMLTSPNAVVEALESEIIGG